MHSLFLQILMICLYFLCKYFQIQKSSVSRDLLSQAVNSLRLLRKESFVNLIDYNTDGIVSGYITSGSEGVLGDV